MNKSVSNCITLVVICILISTCANRGNITGGEKDIEPPEITKSVPENFSTNFKGNLIKIYFNEYIKVKDAQQQLIISPPMKTQPEITPLGGASKYITIKIYDTLQPNTTYAFNFGESIVDNNEQNPYSFYKYVFSTGEYIDSLTVTGTIFDGEKVKPDEFVSVMLYEVDSTFTDSVIFKEYPKYITNTLDSTTAFTLGNLKAGKYLMIALKDENNSNKYEPKADRIAFREEFITIPTDTTYNLKLFTETPEFKAKRPKQIAGQRIAFGYEGEVGDMQIKLLSEKPTGFAERIIKAPEKDTLYYWYTPKIEADSLLFTITNKNYADSMYVNIREMKKDTLTLKIISSGTLKLKEDFEIEASIPFQKIDEKQITILDKDSAKVAFTAVLDTFQNRYKLSFEKKQNDLYGIQMLPGAFADIFENTNDTLRYGSKTKSVSDYGQARIILENAEFPVIVQLTDSKGRVVTEQYAEENKPFDFRNLNPGQFYIRVVYDTNKNGKWDTGDYLKKIQPERISYYPSPIDVRANWDVVETFNLN